MILEISLLPPFVKVCQWKSSRETREGRSFSSYSCMHCNTQWPVACGTPWGSQSLGSFRGSTPKRSFFSEFILWHLPMDTFLSSTGILSSPTRWLYSDFCWPGTLVNFSDIHGHVLTTDLYLSPVESDPFTDLLLSCCSASAFAIVAASCICP